LARRFGRDAETLNGSLSDLFSFVRRHGHEGNPRSDPYPVMGDCILNHTRVQSPLLRMLRNGNTQSVRFASW
jgi:hypothetical protein